MRRAYATTAAPRASKDQPVDPEHQSPARVSQTRDGSHGRHTSQRLLRVLHVRTEDSALVIPASPFQPLARERNLTMAQKLLRHESPATTAAYLHPLLEDLEAALEALDE